MTESIDTFDLVQLVQLTVDLIDAQAGQTIPPGKHWLNDTATLALKIFHHASSVSVLCRGTDFVSGEERRISFIDYASISLIARATLENYLVFSYIYDAKNMERSEYRHMTWQMSGLMDRQKYISALPENNQKQKFEAETIGRLMEKIKTNPHFQMLTSKQQERLIKGEWRMNLQWIDLAMGSGLDRQYFINIYKHFCGYSHTAYLSTLQMRDSWNSFQDQQKMTVMVAGVVCSVLAHFAHDYCEFFPAARAALYAHPSHKRIADNWRVTREQWAEFRSQQQGQ